MADNGHTDSKVDFTPAADLPVHCGRCNWIGTFEQLKVIYTPNPSDPGDVIPTTGCPACLDERWLEFKEE